MLFHENRLHALNKSARLSSGIIRLYFKCQNPTCHGKIQCDDTGQEGVYANIRNTEGLHSHTVDEKKYCSILC